MFYVLREGIKTCRPGPSSCTYTRASRSQPFQKNPPGKSNDKKLVGVMDYVQLGPRLGFVSSARVGVGFRIGVCIYLSLPQQEHHPFHLPVANFNKFTWVQLFQNPCLVIALMIPADEMSDVSRYIVLNCLDLPLEI